MYSEPAVECGLVTDEVVNQSRYGALPLSYGAAPASCAGGIRTGHRPKGGHTRLPKHVLPSGRRSCLATLQRRLSSDLGFLTGRCSPNRQLVGQRRRRDSNPLEAALQAAAWPPGSSVIKCPSLESNLVFDLRRVACKIHHTPRTNSSAPCRGIERASGRFEVCHAVHHTRRVCVSVARPGIEPGPGTARRVIASEADMRSGTLTGHIVKGVATWKRNSTKTFGESGTARAPCAAWSAVVGCPLHHRDTRADDWIRTRINRPRKVTQSRPAPFSVEPRRHQAGVQGVEPCWAVLEAACFPEAHSCIPPSSG